ncbi:hypothetical protein [Xanthomonas citri]|uniref:HORMA-1 domain-containing protein n=1 Tax=Xanthomonas citri TaxID=346 RepID=UPI000C0692DB|nr:hypothetical protein [Xanthomonas citri]
MSTATATSTQSYSVADVELVMRRVTADLIMIASSTGAVTEKHAQDWAHDIEILAKKGYLKAVDLTLLSDGVEQRATRFDVNVQSGDLTMSRPGGVLWPKVPNAHLQIVLFYMSSYDQSARQAMRDKLNISWSPTNADTTHSQLSSHANRDYASNSFGMQRKDYTR